MEFEEQLLSKIQEDLDYPNIGKFMDEWDRLSDKDQQEIRDLVIEKLLA